MTTLLREITDTWVLDLPSLPDSSPPLRPAFPWQTRRAWKPWRWEFG